MGISINQNFITSSIDTSMQKTDKSVKLQEMLNTDLENASDQQLRGGCESFEAYMVEQMFKQMRATVGKMEGEDNPYMDYFGELMYQQYAEDVAKRGELGIAKQLYESMKRDFSL